MSNKPADELQAEALDLSLEERARLAYRLLESLDKPVVADVPGDAGKGEHKGEGAPAEPKPRANPLPQYRVRLDDGDSVAIPVRFTVRPDPKPATAADGTVSADALRAGEIAAGQRDLFPSPKSTSTPISAGKLDSDSALGVPDAQAVAALLHRLSPEGRPPIEQLALTAPDAAARVLNLAPDPFAPKPPVLVEDSEQDPFADWEAGIEADDGQTDTQALIGLGTRLPVRRRTGVVVTSVVGGVGAMAALGVVVLQGRNPAPDDYTTPVSAVMPAAPVLSAPSQGTPSAPAALAAANSEPRSTSNREPAAQPSTQPSDESDAPAEATPNNRVPAIPSAIPSAIPTLGTLAITDANVAPARIGAPSEVLLTRGNDASNQPLQLPQLRNTDRVQQALEREYPIGLRSVGTGGTVQISFYVNEQGTVERFQIEESSGVAALDQAAMRVAPVFDFTPAQRGNEKVAGWFTRAITFGTGASVANAVAQPTGGGKPDPNRPAVTRFDLAPQVRNTDQIRQEIERAYPVNLRDAGVGGKAEVWFYITEQGAVERTLLKKTSGNTALDQVALRVAKVFQFNPGQTDGQRVAGWFSVVIAFDARTGGAGLR